MVRVLCAVKVRQVAAHTVGAGAGEIVVGMARRALQPGMRAGKRKAGKFRVVEFCSHPAIQRVALLAIGRVTDRRMIGIACSCVVS